MGGEAAPGEALRGRDDVVPRNVAAAVPRPQRVQRHHLQRHAHRQAAVQGGVGGGGLVQGSGGGGGGGLAAVDRFGGAVGAAPQNDGAPPYA